MPFFDERKGTLSLGEDCLLLPRMPARDVLKALRTLGGSSPDLGGSGIVPFPMIQLAGGKVAPIAFLEAEELCATRISVVSVGQRAVATADQQRAFLFAAFSCKDPCPDTRRACQFQASFGSLILSTDPRTGCAVARLCYRPNNH